MARFGRGGVPNGIRDLKCAGADTLSKAAFDRYGVRHTPYNVPFDCFLPLALNPAHQRRALPLLPACLGKMLRQPAGSGGPDNILVAIAMLIKTTSVEMVGGAVGSGPTTPYGGTPPAITNVMSDAALQIFCHLHHLLLAVVLEPGGDKVLASARQQVLSFVQGGPQARTKARCPDLGVLLVALLLVPRMKCPGPALRRPS